MKSGLYYTKIEAEKINKAIKSLHIWIKIRHNDFGDVPMIFL